jgi:aminopeptidase N
LKRLALLIILLILAIQVDAQLLTTKSTYTKQDTLRGSITPQRAWWDLLKYELSISISPQEKSITGTNVISYKVLETGAVMQIDLQAPLHINKVTQDGKDLEVKQVGAAHFVELIKNQKIGDSYEIKIEYSGKPQAARNAPWDGGFTWTKDSSGKDFIATSCQGIGASLWWPCKDHMYDEPDDGAIIHVNVPGDLIAVSNGRLIKQKTEKDKTKTFTWQVVNPINNYGINVNVGDYVHFSEKYQGEKGPLDMDYWVLRGNLEKAKEHFKDAAKTIKEFEHWFGPYPFYEDSYKLVEVPYLGMEHQSSVTYGNGYRKGYL